MQYTITVYLRNTSLAMHCVTWVEPSYTIMSEPRPFSSLTYPVESSSVHQLYTSDYLLYVSIHLKRFPFSRTELQNITILSIPTSTLTHNMRYQVFVCTCMLVYTLVLYSQLAGFLKYLSSPALVDLFPDPPPPPPEGILLTHTPQLCAGGTPEENCATNYIQDITQCVSAM